MPKKHVKRVDNKTITPRLMEQMTKQELLKHCKSQFRTVKVQNIQIGKLEDEDHKLRIHNEELRGRIIKNKGKVPRAPGRDYQKKVDDELIIEALEKSAGVLSTAAKQLGIDHRTLSRRLKDSLKLQKAKALIEEVDIDICESQLKFKLREVEKDKDGNTACPHCKRPYIFNWPQIQFYLLHKGNERGYSNKVENTNLNFKGGSLETYVEHRRRVQLAMEQGNILKDDEG